MKPDFSRQIRLKSLDEIVSRVRELIKRHRRRFIARNLRPCPENCKFAMRDGNCRHCGARHPNKHCFKPERFVPILTKQELYDQFQEDICDSEILLRDYRDLVVFYWILGAFDGSVVNREVLRHVETSLDNNQPNSESV